MTIQPPAPGSTEFWAVAPIGGFPFYFIITWGSAVAVLVAALAISLRWLVKRTPNRDPTIFAGFVIAQMLLFLLLETVASIRMMTDGPITQPGNAAMWYLCLAQIVGSLLSNIIVCLFSLAIVCFASRRLPKSVGATVLPVVLVLIDVTVLLMLATHLSIMKK